MALYKRPNSKYWWMKFTFDGELVQQSTKCKSKGAAQTVESAYRTQLALGKVGIKPKSAAPTFEQAAADFLEWSKLNHAQKPSSFRRVGFSTKPLQTFFGKKKVDLITIKDIEKFLIWRSKQISKKTNEPISRDTINMELIVLKTIFKRLAKADILTKNPAADIALLAKNKRKFYVLSEAEEKLYLLACPQPLQDVATLILETGMRPAEIYTLARRSVSLEKGFLQIEDSKTESSNRKIWLSEKAESVLKSRAAGFKGEYLFPKGDADGEPPTYQLNDQHRTALSKLCFKFRIYDLRHTFATRILESGKTDLLTLASMLGHSSLDQVMRYAHPSEKRKAEAVRESRQKQSEPDKNSEVATLSDTCENKMVSE